MGLAHEPCPKVFLSAVLLLLFLEPQQGLLVAPVLDFSPAHDPLHDPGMLAAVRKLAHTSTYVGDFLHLAGELLFMLPQLG